MNNDDRTCPGMMSEKRKYFSRELESDENYKPMISEFEDSEYIEEYKYFLTIQDSYCLLEKLHMTADIGEDHFRRILQDCFCALIDQNSSEEGALAIGGYFKERFNLHGIDFTTFMRMIRLGQKRKHYFFAYEETAILEKGRFPNYSKYVKNDVNTMFQRYYNVPFDILHSSTYNSYKYYISGREDRGQVVTSLRSLNEETRELNRRLET